MPPKQQSQQQQYYQNPEANLPLDKIVFVQRILRFACKHTLDVVAFSQVNSTWRETVVDYDTAALVWYRMLGKCSLLYDPNVTNSSLIDDDETEAGVIVPKEDEQRQQEENRRNAARGNGASATAMGDRRPQPANQRSSRAVDNSSPDTDTDIDTDAGTDSDDQEKDTDRNNNSNNNRHRRPGFANNHANARAPANKHSAKTVVAAPTPAVPTKNAATSTTTATATPTPTMFAARAALPTITPPVTKPEDVAHRQRLEIEFGEDRNLNRVFHAAVESETLWVIRQLLAAGIRQQCRATSKNQADRGYYPLHMAVIRGCEGALRILVEHSLEYRNMEKIKAKNSRKKNRVISNKGNDNGNGDDDDDDSRRDAENESEDEDDDETFKSIDINVPAAIYSEKSGKTPLHIAATTGFTPVGQKCGLSMVKMLIEYGNANPNLVAVANYYGGGPSLLHDIIESMRNGVQGTAATILHYLITNVPGINLDPENASDGDATPLQFAVKKSYFEAARVLLEAGANPNYQSDKRGSVKRGCLHFTAQNEGGSDTRFTRLLLANGAHPDLQECHDFTPLHVACMYGNFEIVQMLLAAKDEHGGVKNAHPSLVDTCNQTPRDFARKRGYEKIVSILPESSADTVHEKPSTPSGIGSKMSELAKPFTGATTTKKIVKDDKTGETTVISSVVSHALSAVEAANNRAKAVGKLFGTVASNKNTTTSNNNRNETAKESRQQRKNSQNKKDDDDES